MRKEPTQAPLPYSFDPEFEAGVIKLCCSHPDFWGTCGRHLDPECAGSPAATVLLRACRSIEADLGRGPDAISAVTQRVKRWSCDGKVLLAVYREAIGLLLGAPSLDPETAAAELVPVLKPRARKAAGVQAIAGMREEEGLGDAIEAMQEAESLGAATNRVDEDFNDPTASFNAVYAAQQVDLLPLGIAPLDDALNGGVPRGTLTTLLGASGSGKSMGLVQVAAAGLLQQRSVAFVSLELSRARIYARLLACLSGIAEKSLRSASAEDWARAREHFGRTIGRFYFAEMPPKVTSARDVLSFMRRVEERAGGAVDLLVIDYADRLSGRKPEMRSYETGEDVYENLRLDAEDRSYCCVTASQATRQTKSQGGAKSRCLGLNDFADSMGKPRVCDIAISLNPSGEGPNRMITGWMAKNRGDQAEYSIGPWVPGFEYGRLGPMTI